MARLTANAPTPKEVELADGHTIDLDAARDIVIFEKNASFDEPFTFGDLVSEYKVAKYVLYGLRTGAPIKLLGHPGVGKSAVVRCFMQALNIPTVIIPAPNRAPEDLVSVYPSKEDVDGVREWVLERKLDAGLTADEPFVLIVEEMSRAPKTVQNQLLELSQEKRLADVPLNILAVFACDNEAAVEGFAAGTDFTLSDRWSTIKVKYNDLPWREALAAKYSGIDLKPAYKVVDDIVDPALRRNLSNRTFEHVVFCLLNRMPGIWGLGIREKRNYLVDGSGNDRTDEIIGKIAAALGVRQPDTMPDPFVTAFNTAVRHGVNLIAFGQPGIGKTSYTRSRLVEEGFDAEDVLVLSGPVAQTENMLAQIPDGNQIRPVLMDWFARPARTAKGKVLVLDEIWRASPMTRHRFLEILQERTLGGLPIRDLVTVIALNNPRKFAGMDLNTSLPDFAQSDRFFMSIEIGPGHIPWADHLLRKYGEVAEPFVEWWSELLSLEAKELVTARTLERMINHFAYDLPLQEALVYIDAPGDDGHYVGVPLVELEQLLAERPLMYLQKIVNEVDFYEAALRDSADTDPVQLVVLKALSGAHMPILEKNRDAVVRLCRYMTKQNWVVLLTAADERQNFFKEVLRTARSA